MYTALDVSRYVITQCSQAEKPISNLKLQKVLYFLWADSTVKQKNTCFLMIFVHGSSDPSSLMFIINIAPMAVVLFILSIAPPLIRRIHCC